MNRIAILEGYSMPKHRRKSRKSSGGVKKMQSKMKTCAGKWRKSGKRGKYTSFMKACLRK